MAKWTGKTKGTLLGYQFFGLLIRVFGLNISYFFLQIVSYYYYLFSREQKSILIEFYKHILNCTNHKAERLVRKNFFILAQSIVDRMAFATGRASKITTTNFGEDTLRKAAAAGKGLILVSAHISNWDVAGRVLGVGNTKINVLMYENEHESIKNYLEKQDTGRYNVIEMRDDMSHLIKIYAAVKNGEVVCIHGDRFTEGATTYQIDFFNKPALFPSGPFEMIKKLKVPYSFVFSSKTSRFNYHFTATQPITPNTSAEEIANEFVSVLEKKVANYPEQWFNYYKFHLE